MTESGSLQAWLHAQLATGLPALAGARVAGTVPVQVELLNEIIAGALADASAPRGPAAPRTGLPIDLATVARLVRRLRVDAEPGVVRLDFEIGVDG